MERDKMWRYSNFTTLIHEQDFLGELTLVATEFL